MKLRTRSWNQGVTYVRLANDGIKRVVSHF